MSTIDTTVFYVMMCASLGLRLGKIAVDENHMSPQLSDVEGEASDDCASLAAL